MADVTALLRRTLQQLRADRTRIDRQITALEGALTTLGGRAGRRAAGRREEGEEGRHPPAADDQRHAEEGDRPAHEGVLGAAPTGSRHVSAERSPDGGRVGNQPRGPRTPETTNRRNR